MYTNVLTKILPSSPKKSPDPGNLQKTTARSSKILSINLLYCVTIYMAAFWTQTQLRTTEPLYGVCEVRLLFTVQSLSRVWLCDPVDCSTPVSPSFTVSRNLLKLMSIEPVMPSNQLILCCPLLPLPSIFPSIRVFSNKSALRIRRPNYWSFNISPSNEIQGWFLLGLRFLDKPQSSSMSTEKPILMKIYCDSTVVCYLDSTSGNNSLPRQTLGVLAADSLQLSACSELTQTQRTA